LEELSFDLRVLISKRHTGQKNPACFASTRSDCKPQAILPGDTGRWSCEGVNFYLKVQTGNQAHRQEASAANSQGLNPQLFLRRSVSSW